jgi:hypothetical protein
MLLVLCVPGRSVLLPVMQTNAASSWSQQLHRCSLLARVKAAARLALTHRQQQQYLAALAVSVGLSRKKIAARHQKESGVGMQTAQAIPRLQQHQQVEVAAERQGTATALQACSGATQQAAW